MFLKGLGDLVRIDWDYDTQWEVSFGEKVGKPFDEWLPCTDLTIQEYKYEDFSFPAGALLDLNVPNKRGFGTIDATFLDSGGVIRGYFEGWINVIYPKVGCVACIGDEGVVREMVVSELGIAREERNSRVYRVRIIDGFDIKRGSEGDLSKYSVKFKIYGIGGGIARERVVVGSIGGGGGRPSMSPW